jgi:folate-binding protein YgfZ
MPTDTKSELAAILTGTAIFPLGDRAFLRITGADATRWLNGMVTNSIQSLDPGDGNYNFLLNAQGRIQGDCNIYREPLGGAEPVFVLETDKAQIETIEQLLDKFIIMDDVVLSRGLNVEGDRVEASRIGIALAGRQAHALIHKLFIGRRDTSYIEPPKPGTITPARLEDIYGDVVILTPPNSSIPAYEIWCADRVVVKELYRLLGFSEAVSISAETLEAFRIMQGTPRYGQDIRNNETARDLPQETNQTHALHFTKGCYLGQEIVERIHSRGQVHRTFTGFRLTTLPTTLPTPLIANGKAVGELTSAAILPLPEGDIPFALGYVRREALTQTLDFEGGTATPTTLPFRPS